ncbi:hypothetical protein KKG22_00545 [Patescibacteria group bacterium]|nr:hypothetical protein [Patescibacteria group bacterium]MBU1721485.1 hypothetical protein [Patescibacteria group bacterium]MBU1901344.1 hypothetical protein [Patescibacteria group bacterium]
MNKTTNERFYEKYAWVIFLIIGVMVLAGGIPHMLGNNTDPALVETISGQTIEELKTSSPMFFNLYNFYFSGGGLSDIGVAFFLIVISTFAFKTGQKWSWYSFLFVPLFFIGWLFLILPLPDQAQSSMFTPLIVFIILSILGLLLPFRKFFPKKITNK